MKFKVGDYVSVNVYGSYVYPATVVRLNDEKYTLMVDFSSEPPPMYDGRVMVPSDCDMSEGVAYRYLSDGDMMVLAKRSPNLKSRLRELWDPLVKSLAGP